MKELKYNLNRINDNTNSTIGYITFENSVKCFTLEDEHRDIKVKGETRIPAKKI